MSSADSESKRPSRIDWLDRLPGFFLLIVRRQQYHRGLVILALLGVILSVGLVTNASFFSQAVDRVILEQNLAEFSQETGRPPFSTNVYVFPSARTSLTLQDSERISGQIGAALSSEVGLPLRQLGLELSSGAMLLQPAPGSDLYGQDRELLGSVSIVYLADVTTHMELDAGIPVLATCSSASLLRNSNRDFTRPRTHFHLQGIAERSL